MFTAKESLLFLLLGTSAKMLLHNIRLFIGKSEEQGNPRVNNLKILALGSMRCDRCSGESSAGAGTNGNLSHRTLLTLS